MEECRCHYDFCECTDVNSGVPLDDGIGGHCYKCPISIKNIGGGLDCYGVFEDEIPYEYDEDKEENDTE